MASIYVRKNQIWVSLYRDGQRIRKPTHLEDTPRNRRLVEKNLIPKLEDMDFSPTHTVGYYYTLMMKQKKVKSSTLERYYSIFSTYIIGFENREINSIKISELKRWISDMACSPKTIRLNANVFSQIFDEGIYDEAIEKNPFKMIRLPKLIKYEPQPFNDQEINLLMSNADGWFKNLLAMLFMTGMRIGEALALEWKDIDSFILVDKSIRKGIVSTTKTNNSRQIPIFDSLKPYIKQQQLLTGLRGKRVFVGVKCAKDLDTKWHNLLAKCKMDHRVLYQTRHTFAIKALDSGMFKVSQIAKILGHASVQMLFQKYAKFIKSEIDDLPKNFNALDTNLGTQAV